MPHGTFQYVGDGKIHDWAVSFSRRLAGRHFYSFFIAFSISGRAKYVVFGNKPEGPIDSSNLLALRDAECSWFSYDPFEGPEHTLVGWRNVARETLERVMDVRFEPQDFVRNGELVAFPVTWSFIT